jgi:hypothetical protein
MVRKWSTVPISLSYITPPQQVAAAAMTPAVNEPEERTLGDAAGLSVRELRAAVARGQAARERLVERNMRLVGWVAKRYAHGKHGLSLEDLVQEGTVGCVSPPPSPPAPNRGLCGANRMSRVWARRDRERPLNEAQRPHSRGARVAARTGYNLHVEGRREAA